MEEKKNSKYDINRYRGLFFNGGLVLSLSLVLMAFEWKTPEVASVIDLSTEIPDDVTLIEPPATIIPPPPKPKVEVFQLIEKPDEEIIDEPEILVDMFIEETDVIEEVEFVEEIPEEEPEKIHTIVEKMPSFQGGDQAMFVKYIGERIKYPKLAQRIGKEGKVFVQFVVDKDGSMTEISVVKGIGAGCDEEVLRVMKDAPKWEPGKQRGRAVRVRMIVPVRFDLN